jgi:hypothetical protein
MDDPLGGMTRHSGLKMLNWRQATPQENAMSSAHAYAPSSVTRIFVQLYTFFFAFSSYKKVGYNSIQSDEQLDQI